MGFCKSRAFARFSPEKKVSRLKLMAKFRKTVFELPTPLLSMIIWLVTSYFASFLPFCIKFFWSVTVSCLTLWTTKFIFLSNILAKEQINKHKCVVVRHIVTPTLIKHVIIIFTYKSCCYQTVLSSTAWMIIVMWLFLTQTRALLIMCCFVYPCTKKFTWFPIFCISN